MLEDNPNLTDVPAEVRGLACMEASKEMPEKNSSQLVHAAMEQRMVDFRDDTLVKV